MIIKNGSLLNEEFQFVKKDIAFHETVTQIDVDICGEDVIDATDCYVVPGFVDTHMHAALGESFVGFKEDSVERIAAFEASRGTTTLVATVGAEPEEVMKNAVCHLVKKSKELPPNCARIMGIHLEGPFFSTTYKGGFEEGKFRSPSVSEIKDLCAAGEGMIKIVSMAPELEGALSVIRYLAERRITISLGHSAATYDKTIEAFETGATQVTHMFNAMSPLKHREPGMAGAAMISEKASCELIADLFHVHQDIVKLLYRIKGADKLIMISDSEVGTGLPDGEYEENGTKVIVKDRKVYTEDGVIYGSSITLLDGIRNLYSIGIPFNDAVKMATINGAKAAGIDREVGSLAVGKKADIVILDSELNIRKVLIGGKDISC